MKIPKRERNNNWIIRNQDNREFITCEDRMLCYFETRAAARKYQKILQKEFPNDKLFIEKG